MELDRESIDAKIGSEIYNKIISENDKIEQDKRSTIINNIIKANNDKNK